MNGFIYYQNNENSHFIQQDIALGRQEEPVEAGDLEAVDIEAADIETVDVKAVHIEGLDIEAVNIKAADTESPPQDNEAAQSTNSDRSRDHIGCTCCSKGVLKTLLLLAVLIICALIAVVVYLYLIPCPATCPPEATTGASTSQNNTSQNNTENELLPQRFYDENYMRYSSRSI